MINDYQKRTYEAGREATESQQRAKSKSLLQILLQMMAQVNPLLGLHAIVGDIVIHQIIMFTIFPTLL